MNTTINNYVKGSYTILNSKDEVIAEIDNRITDYGMELLVGKSGYYGNYAKTPIEGEFLSNIYFSNGVIYNLNLSMDLIPRSDGQLQYNLKGRGTYTFGQDTTITYLRTATAPSTSYTCSEATVSPSLTFKTGETITIIYTLQVITDANKVSSNMSFVTNVTDGVLMPANKTNARHAPVYVDSSYTGSQVHTTMQTDRGHHSNSFSFTKLHFYSDVDIYNTMTSTTTSTSPYTINVLNGPVPLYVQPLTSRSYSSSGNTWSVSLRFIIEPGKWPTTAKGFSLIGMKTNSDYVATAQRANVGIFTALQTPYNPYSKNPNMYVGIDYKFTWTRLN